jgi:hypothetical protein
VALVALATFFAPNTTLAATAATDLRVVSTDSTGLLLELAPPDPRIESERSEDGIVSHRIRVPGWGTTSIPGEPELPVRSVLIQVPPAGEVDVEVEERDVVTLPGLAVAPVAQPRGAIDEPAGSRLTRDEAVYGSTSFQPGTLFELSPRAILRGVPVMRLSLHPFRWNPASGELRQAGSQLVRVRFREPLASEAGIGSGASDLFSPVLAESIVNWQGFQPTSGVTAASVAAILPVGRTGLRMEVREAGLYRVTGSQLVAAGVAIGTIDPRTIRVSTGGREAAVRVVARYGIRMVAQDYVEFYARSLENSFTDTNVYWLFWGGRLGGARTATADGRVTAGSRLSASFPERLHFEEDHKIWDTMPGAPRQDYWFWERLQGPQTVTHTLDVPSVVAAAPATLRISFRGRTEGSHHVRVSLNGANQVGEETWTGTGEHLLTMPVAQGLLTAGVNDCTIVVPGDLGLDQVYVNWIEVDYERTAQAVGDSLRLTVPGSDLRRTLQVAGFTRSSVRVMDVTDPFRPFFLAGGSVALQGGGYRVRFGIGAGGTRSFLVFAAPGVKTPAAVQRWSPRSLTPVGGADYVVITPRAFLAAAEPLLALRREQGLRVQAVAVEDIFDVYGWGLPDPAAIRSFLEDAYQRWTRPAPAYVLLLGDANIDYRDFLGTGKRSLVPTRASATAGLSVTPDDNWFACVDGEDELPDLFIGRVSVGSASAAAAVVAKIVGYEGASRPAAADALFVADNNVPDFEVVAERLTGLLPSTVTPQRMYLSTYTDFGLAKQDLRSAIDAGKLMTIYVGHGDVTGWAGERVLDTTNAPLLANAGHLTFAVILDCLSGYFAQPFYYSIGELLANLPTTGAVGVFAASGFGDTGDHSLLGEELLARSFVEPRLRLGRIATEAKVQAYARGATLDIVRTFTLLGDPATLLASPQ